MEMRFVLHSVGVLAPGLSSLSELLALYCTRQTGAPPALELPSPAMLPANERRRASQVVRLVLACAQQALGTSPYAADQLRSVFASDEGTGEVCQQMLEALVNTGQMSPLLFHNSVHNAPSGYLSIAYQNHQPAVSVSMGSESFAGGLLCAVSEACTSGQPVLFMAYDAPLPEPMRSLLPIDQATASAWIITSGTQSEGTQAALQSPAQAPTETLVGQFVLSLYQGGESPGQAPPTWLPAAWRANSSAQAFSVLALLADGRGSCEFPLGAQRLRVALVDRAAAC